MPTERVGNLFINAQAGPTTDVRVRRAIAHAIDKQGLVNALLQGFGKPVDSIGAEPIFGYLPDIAGYDYDPAKAFAPVALIGATSNIVVVAPALPVKTIAELIAYGKANPGRLSYSTPGAGTPPHMIGEMFKQRAGLDITHVPYKGGGSATQDVVSGQVSLTFENPAVALPLVLAGQIRALAVTSDARNPRIPDVPTLSETIPGFVSASFTGIVAPAAVSRAIVARLNAAINESLKAPAVQATLDQLSVELRPGTPEEFGAFLATEREKWLAVAQAAKIQLD